MNVGVEGKEKTFANEVTAVLHNIENLFGLGFEADEVNLLLFFFCVNRPLFEADFRLELL